MNEDYPHQSGDVTVIGPECFTDAEATVICYKGQNYYLGPNPEKSVRDAWHDAASEAYVDGALSADQASIMWAKNPYRSQA